MVSYTKRLSTFSRGRFFLKPKPVLMSIRYSHFCAETFIVISLIFFTVLLSAQPATCCLKNFTNAGFESSLTNDIRFPDSESPLNARRSDPGDWTYDDGSNDWQSYHIEDASRASEGSRFVYIDYNPSSIPRYNYCVGNLVRRSNSSACKEDQFYDGYRYVVQFDFAPFNINFPDAGVGSGTARPHVEHLFPNTLDLYDKSGQKVSSQNHPAIAWKDIASNWKTAAGVTPEYNVGTNITVWFSHDRNDNSGMLVDNTKFEMVSIDNSELTDISYNADKTEVTFNIDPVSNVPVGVPNIKYKVMAPADYEIVPSEGIYNSSTNFILKKTDGSAFLAAETVTLQLQDEVNNICTAEAILPSSAILPVTLTSFEVYNDNCNSILTWTAENIYGFSHYEVEASDDGRVFSLLAKVDSEANARSLTYRKVLETKGAYQYFRLKMVDQDGKYEYSSIRNVTERCDENGDINIFPNPIFKGEQTEIGFKSNERKILILIYDLSGRQVLSESYNNSEFNDRYAPELSHLAAGHYTVTIQSGHVFRSKKLIIID